MTRGSEWIAASAPTSLSPNSRSRTRCPVSSISNSMRYRPAASMRALHVRLALLELVDDVGGDALGVGFELLGARRLARSFSPTQPVCPRCLPAPLGEYGNNSPRLGAVQRRNRDQIHDHDEDVRSDEHTKQRRNQGAGDWRERRKQHVGAECNHEHDELRRNAAPRDEHVIELVVGRLVRAITVKEEQLDLMHLDLPPQRHRSVAELMHEQQDEERNERYARVADAPRLIKEPGDSDEGRPVQRERNPAPPSELPPRAHLRLPARAASTSPSARCEAARHRPRP